MIHGSHVVPGYEALPGNQQIAGPAWLVTDSWGLL